MVNDDTIARLKADLHKLEVALTWRMVLASGFIIDAITVLDKLL